MVRGSLICQPIHPLRGNLLAMKPKLGLCRAAGVLVIQAAVIYKRVSIFTKPDSIGLTDHTVRAFVIATVLVNNNATAFWIYYGIYRF